MKKRCVVCDNMMEETIMIYRSDICLACEYNMVHTDVREKKYHYYLTKMKQVTLEPLLHSIKR